MSTQMILDPCAAAFCAFLDRQSIPHSQDTARLHVLGSIVLGPSDIVQIPENTTFHEDLYLIGSPVMPLPHGLVVLHDLAIHNSRMTDLPEDITLGHSLLVHQSLIHTLPAGLHVPGSMSISQGPLDALPKGLRVGECLDIAQSLITRLPRDMRVGHAILPPQHLTDIAAFMQTLGPDDHITLSYHGSHHRRMQLHERLAPFPDLLQVVEHMRADHVLKIRVAHDGYPCTIVPMHPA